MDSLDFNFAHSIALFAATSKTGEAVDTRDYVICNNKAPLPEFNQGFLKQPSYKLGRALDRALEYYARAKIPFRVHVPDAGDAVTNELLARGFTRALDLPVMTLEARATAPAVPGLSIEAVRDAASLQAFQRIAFEGFGYPVEIAPLAITDELARSPHVAMFVGALNGEPACCAMLMITGDVAGIYWVATLAAHRKLGLGAAITAHAAHAGFARGCRVACLQASPMGAPVYRRIGFAHARTYLRFDHAAIA